MDLMRPKRFGKPFGKRGGIGNDDSDAAAAPDDPDSDAIDVDVAFSPCCFAPSVSIATESHTRNTMTTSKRILIRIGRIGLPYVQVGYRGWIRWTLLEAHPEPNYL